MSIPESPSFGGGEPNTCQRQAATMTPRELACAARIYETYYPDADLQIAIDANTAEASYFLRCGVLGKEPPDGE